MKYLNKAEDRKVYLQKSGREDVVSVMSLQFAQEGELGSSVVFDLELERMAEDEKTFALDVVGLPSKYRYQFEYQGKQLSQVKFSQGMAKLSLGLRVWVPRELPEEEIGKPVSFFAVVADKYGAEQLRRLRRKLGGRQIREDDLKPLKLGYEVLELTPKGVGEIELSSPNLYYEIRPDQKLEMKFTLRNTGTVVLEDVRVEVDPPAQWEYRVVPEKVDRIEPQKEVPVKVEVTPPGDVEVGKYEVKVGASCEHEGKLVEAQEKNVTVNVQGKANVLGSALLVMLLVGIVVGVAIFTVKLSRR
ncbi:MAG TPA: hypothetical protein ENF74_03285 [Firmicutes bacterium]|nr:hypothetical protein [Bacillota bacterium]